MPQAQTEPKAHKTKRHTINPWLRSLLVGLGAVVIFGVGWSVGSGRIGLTGFTNYESLNSNLPATLDYSSVTEVYRVLKNSFDGKLNEEELINGLKSGLVKAANDPYTEYLSKEEYQSFNEELNGSFTGIGAELTQDDKGNVVVVAPIAGFPAEKAGLQPQDMIVRIDDTPTAGMTVSEAVEKIRGPKGSKVTLTVIRDNRQELNFEIERDVINIPSVKATVKDGVGYLEISRFNEETAHLAQEAAQDFKQQNVTGIVLDLRSNPGGLLNSAISVSSLWLPEGTTILTERRGEQVINTFKAEGKPVLQGIPTVVLIDKGSASSSEIVAGALKDNGAATIVGEKSFGKGSVQQIIQLKAGGALKVTIARWFTPGGKNIDKSGIEPDKQVSISEDDVKNDRDPQTNAALEALR